MATAKNGARVALTIVLMAMVALLSAALFETGAKFGEIKCRVEQKEAHHGN